MLRLFVSLFFCLAGAAFAELPPSAYEAMQTKSPEYLNIEVLRVNIEAGSKPDQQLVHVMAIVGKVIRTSNGLKEGDVVNIVYSVTAHAPGWAGPREIPILAEKDSTVAYLARLENSLNYTPTAGSMSFRNF